MDTKTAADHSDDRRRSREVAESPPKWYALVPGALCLGGGATIALVAILG
jgi:hypothetical protein